MIHDYTGKKYFFYCERCKKNTLHREYLDEKTKSNPGGFFSIGSMVYYSEISYICAKCGKSIHQNEYLKKYRKIRYQTRKNLKSPVKKTYHKKRLNNKKRRRVTKRKLK